MFNAFESYFITIPLIAALIGWITNVIAVKMLFHPKLPVRLWFFSIQGVFPKRQNQFAEKLGNLVSTELLSEKEISALIANLSHSDAITAQVENALKKLLIEKIPVVFPMAAMFLNDEVVGQIIEAMRPDIEPMLKEVLSYAGNQISEQVSIKDIVSAKVRAFSSEKLEEIIFSIMKRELRTVEIVGGILGFMIGITQVILIQLPL